MKFNFNLLPACCLNVFIVLLLINGLIKKHSIIILCIYFLIFWKMYLSITGFLCSTIYNIDCNARYIVCVCAIYFIHLNTFL